MVHTSSAYKRIMAQKLRNRGYVSISLGVINGLAQEGAQVVSELTRWSAGNIFKTKNSNKVDYATLEEKSNSSDGFTVFMPEVNQYKDNGVTTKNIGDSLRIELNNTYTIKGITFDFGDNYPTEFTLEVNNAEYTINNDSSVYENTAIILHDINYILIKNIVMRYPNQRLRIKSMLMGVGLYFDDVTVQSVTCDSHISPISQDISYQKHTIAIYDTQHQFDVDNPASFMQFLETMQKVDISIGLDLGNNRTEWVKMCSAYLESWNVKKNILTLVATDRLSQLQNEYSLGNTIHSRTAYAELVSILQDAGLESDEYEIDEFLENVYLLNPIPTCLHREAIQMVCNATRCIFYEDEEGVLCISANFAYSLNPSEIDTTSECGSYVAWSHPETVLTTAFVDYADLSAKRNDSIGGQIFLPENNREWLRDTGFITDYVANENGVFFDDDWLSDFIFPAYFTFHSVHVSFAGVVPDSITIHAYDTNGGHVIASQEFTNLSENNTLILNNFEPFDDLLITVNHTLPGARCVITHVSFDNSTGYEVSKELLLEPIQTYQGEKIKSVKVKVYTFENDEEQKPVEVEDNVFITKSMALTGVDKTCENPLIHTETQAGHVADWLSTYFEQNIGYNASFRGEPTLQAGDIIHLANDFVDNLQANVERTTFSYNGAFSGKLELKRIAQTTEEE